MAAKKAITDVPVEGPDTLLDAVLAAGADGLQDARPSSLR